MKEIQSVQNNIIKEAIKLQDKKWRLKANLFLVEGYHLINEAYLHGLLKTIFSINQKDESKYLVEQFYLVTPQIIKKLSSTVNPQGIIGIVQKPQFKKIDLSNPNIKLVLLDGINDPGNLGSIVRTAAAMGYDGIYMSKDTVDIYNEKSLRATQGAIFKIPFYYVDLYETINSFKEHEIRCLGTTLDAEVELESINSIKKYAVAFGNEARGMSEEIKKVMDLNIKIAMANNVESLNVLSASSIILYELKKNN